jgi:hypothetical protein
MNTKPHSKFLAIFFIALCFTCSENDEVKLYSTDSIPGKITKLGKKLKNPYKVSVMKKALENLRKLEGGRLGLTDIQSQQLLSELDIRTTTVYVRFLPADYV